jgi:phosphoserine phosphatase RsbU/P
MVSYVASDMPLVNEISRRDDSFRPIPNTEYLIPLTELKPDQGKSSYLIRFIANVIIVAGLSGRGFVMFPAMEDLKEANNFLNMLLDNINVAVLIADENLRIYRFNDSFLNLFDEPLEKVAGEALGQAIGCIHTIDENKPCGETSFCTNCHIRQCMTESMLKKIPVGKRRVEKTFYIDGKPQNKILELTTRFIQYDKRQMVLAIFYDVTEIEQQRIVLENKQKQLDLDLASAAGIQQSLLPDSAPELPGIRIAWKFKPSSQIGGDIFNIQPIDDNHFELYMLDVCGHGVSAAFFAVAVYQFLQSRSFLDDQGGIVSPKTVLGSLNKDFPFERFDSYFSLVYVIVDCKRRQAVYSCAGHPPPVLIQADGNLKTLNQRGPVIGLSEDTVYEEETVLLTRGDKLILYTDGVFENRNVHEEYLGRQRFYETLNKYGHKPIGELIELSYLQIEKFSNTVAPDDDVSILGVEFKDVLNGCTR